MNRGVFCATSANCQGQSDRLHQRSRSPFQFVSKTSFVIPCPPFNPCCPHGTLTSTRRSCPELCLQWQQHNLFLVGAHLGRGEVFDEFQLISPGDLRVTHLIHDRLDQVRPAPAQ